MAACCHIFVLYVAFKIQKALCYFPGGRRFQISPMSFAYVGIFSWLRSRKILKLNQGVRTWIFMGFYFASICRHVSYQGFWGHSMHHNGILNRMDQHDVFWNSKIKELPISYILGKIRRVDRSLKKVNTTFFPLSLWNLMGLIVYIYRKRVHCLYL